MATPNYTPFGADDEPPRPAGVSVEHILTRAHGDLHVVIPSLLINYSVVEVAQRLSTNHQTVSPSWVYTWLSRNGYQRRTSWHRGTAPDA